jgi:DNA invertase Pin-like site-specific DNA recombinase
MARLITAVGYLRMSTDKQETSPEQQRAEIEKYAAQHGYQVMRWYADLGVSGDKTDMMMVLD